MIRFCARCGSEKVVKIGGELKKADITGYRWEKETLVCQACEFVDSDYVPHPGPPQSDREGALAGQVVEGDLWQPALLVDKDTPPLAPPRRIREGIDKATDEACLVPTEREKRLEQRVRIIGAIKPYRG